MKPRYFVRQDTLIWLVLDRLQIKEKPNDVVASLVTRKDARRKARELNDQDRPSATQEVLYDTRPD